MKQIRPFVWSRSVYQSRSRVVAMSFMAHISAALQ
jgi:hypothetical protein